MKDQNYSNHSRMVPMYHYVLTALILLMIVCASISLYRHWYSRLGLMLPALALLASGILLLVAFFARHFAIIAQDRAIRAEENLRYFAITGNLLDSRLTLPQIIALRFAPNNELLDLAHKAAEQKLSPKEIKESIKTWRADNHRV